MTSRIGAHWAKRHHMNQWLSTVTLLLGENWEIAIPMEREFPFWHECLLQLVFPCELLPSTLGFPTWGSPAPSTLYDDLHWWFLFWHDNLLVITYHCQPSQDFSKYSHCPWYWGHPHYSGWMSQSVDGRALQPRLSGSSHRHPEWDKMAIVQWTIILIFNKYLFNE